MTESTLARSDSESAHSLVVEIARVLKNVRSVSSSNKRTISNQIEQMDDNIVTLLWKLSQVRRARSLMKSDTHEEMERMENRLTLEIGRSVKTLEEALVSVTMLNIAGDQLSADRLLQILKDSNK